MCSCNNSWIIPPIFARDYWCVYYQVSVLSPPALPEATSIGVIIGPVVAALVVSIKMLVCVVFTIAVYSMKNLREAKFDIRKEER